MMSHYINSPRSLAGFGGNYITVFQPHVFSELYTLAQSSQVYSSLGKSCWDYILVQPCLVQSLLVMSSLDYTSLAQSSLVQGRSCIILVQLSLAMSSIVESCYMDTSLAQSLQSSLVLSYPSLVMLEASSQVYQSISIKGRSWGQSSLCLSSQVQSRRGHVWYSLTQSSLDYPGLVMYILVQSNLVQSCKREVMTIYTSLVTISQFRGHGVYILVQSLYTSLELQCLYTSLVMYRGPHVTIYQSSTLASSHDRGSCYYKPISLKCVFFLKMLKYGIFCLFILFGPLSIFGACVIFFLEN